MLTKFHKEVFCLLDEWHGLTMDDIRILEDEVKRELDAKINDLGLTSQLQLNESGSIKSTPF